MKGRIHGDHLWDNKEPPKVERVVYILPKRVNLRQFNPVAFHFILHVPDFFFFWHQVGFLRSITSVSNAAVHGEYRAGGDRMPPFGDTAVGELTVFEK